MYYLSLHLLSDGFDPNSRPSISAIFSIRLCRVVLQTCIFLCTLTPIFAGNTKIRFGLNTGFIQAPYTEETELYPSLEAALENPEYATAVAVSAQSKSLVEIRKLRRLQFLYLDDTFTADSYYLSKEGVDVFFKIFGELPELEYISIHDSRLLPYLEHLQKIKGLKIRKFDWNIFQNNIRNYENLEILVIEDAMTPQLPGVIGQLRSLKQLELNTISVKALPDLTMLQNLVVFHATLGKLTALPPSLAVLQNLRYFKLTGLVYFRAFPKEICGLSALEELHFELRNAQPLPEELGNLAHLKKIYLYDCQAIKELPASISKLQLLEEIYLSDAGRNLNLSALSGIGHPFTVFLNRCSYIPLVKQLASMQNLKALVIPLSIYPGDLAKIQELLPPDKILKTDM